MCNHRRFTRKPYSDINTFDAQFIITTARRLDPWNYKERVLVEGGRARLNALSSVSNEKRKGRREEPARIDTLGVYLFHVLHIHTILYYYITLKSVFFVNTAVRRVYFPLPLFT